MSNQTEPTDAASFPALEDVTDRRVIEALMSEGGGTAVLDFWSPTCGPCAQMAPDFQAVADAYGDKPVRFIKVNTHAAPEIANAFRVRAVPTLLFVHDGKIMDVSVGAMRGPALSKKADWLLGKASGKGFFARLFS